MGFDDLDWLAADLTFYENYDLMVFSVNSLKTIPQTSVACSIHPISIKSRKFLTQGSLKSEKVMLKVKLMQKSFQLFFLISLKANKNLQLPWLNWKTFNSSHPMFRSSENYQCYFDFTTKTMGILLFSIRILHCTFYLELRFMSVEVNGKDVVPH